MSDLFVYAIALFVVLHLRHESLECSAGVEVALPVVVAPVIADPWLSESTPVPATTPSVVPVAPLLLLAPAVEIESESISFIDSLMEIADPRKSPRLSHLTIVQLRSLGSLHQIKGASRWTKTQAIEVLSAA